MREYNLHLPVLYYVRVVARFIHPGIIMKKALAVGVLTGLALSAVLLLIRQRRFKDTEFNEFFDSSAIADELFGDAFEELPDKA
jgi:hypothetical protein